MTLFGPICSHCASFGRIPFGYSCRNAVSELSIYLDQEKVLCLTSTDMVLRQQMSSHPKHTTLDLKFKQHQSSPQLF